MLTLKASTKQRGAALLESLVAVLIISIGILAVIGMQASAIQATTDTQYRSEATYLIDKVVGQMLLNIDRTSSAATQTSLDSFLHNTAESTDPCLFDGSAASNATISSWISEVTGSNGLPGATADHIQIRQDSSTNAGNRMIISVRWQAPWESTCHQQSVVAYIN